MKNGACKIILSVLLPIGVGYLLGWLAVYLIELAR